MVAIRNLYWTEPLTTFIVGGLIQFAAFVDRWGGAEASVETLLATFLLAAFGTMVKET
jgi:hypothetical protein